MKIKCPNCGTTIVVNNIRRPRLPIPVKNVYDALRECRSIHLAAEELGCSAGYIYNLLRKEGRTLGEFLPAEVPGLDSAENRQGKGDR